MSTPKLIKFRGAVYAKAARPFVASKATVKERNAESKQADYSFSERVKAALNALLEDALVILTPRGYASVPGEPNIQYHVNTKRLKIMFPSGKYYNFNWEFTFQFVNYNHIELSVYVLSALQPDPVEYKVIDGDPTANQLATAILKCVHHIKQKNQVSAG